jgi:hypothetical protein
MIWLEHNYNEPEYELRRQSRRARDLRLAVRLDWKPESKIENYRWERQRFAGRLGEWPHFKPDTRRPVRASKSH